MRKNNTKRSLFLLTILMACIMIVPTSCYRNTDCTLVITILDVTNNAPIVGAQVHVYPKPGSGGNLQIQDQTSSTDASGVVTYTFKYAAMLQVDINPPAPYSPPLQSKLVKLEEGQSVSYSIKI